MVQMELTGKSTGNSTIDRHSGSESTTDRYMIVIVLIWILQMNIHIQEFKQLIRNRIKKRES